MKNHAIESISEAPLAIAGVGRMREGKKIAVSEKAARELFIDARKRRVTGKDQIVIVSGPDGKRWDLNKERPWIVALPPLKIVKEKPAPKPVETKKEKE